MVQISPEQVADYRRDGVVVLRQVVTRVTLDRLAQGVEDNLASPSPWSNDYTPAGDGGRFFDDYVSWQRIPSFATAALEGELPEIAGQLMGTRTPRFFHEHVLVKEPGTATPTPWHHDDPYYGVDGMDNVSLWVPLDPVPVDIALQCFSGSHRWGRRFIPNRFVDQTPYIETATGFEPMPAVHELDEPADIVSCPVEPGDLVAFHFRTLHGSPGTSGHRLRRRVVSMRYVGDDVRWATRPWKTSPPFEANGLIDGDELDDVRFPRVTLA